MSTLLALFSSFVHSAHVCACALGLCVFVIHMQTAYVCNGCHATNNWEDSMCVILTDNSADWECLQNIYIRYEH